MVDERNTIDHIFSLAELCNYHDRNKTPLHLAYIDFSKAFDGVPRNALLLTLQKLGINHRLYQAIKAMYRKTTAKCLANGAESRDFEIFRGVAQGCPLSPTLFACYINPLINQIDDLQNGVNIGDGRNPIGIMAYADDIVMLANTNDELQRSIQTAHDWCETWGMKANIAKCGVQSFGAPKDENVSIMWGSAHFPVVDFYKYLGLTFEKNMNMQVMERRCIVHKLTLTETDTVMCTNAPGSCAHTSLFINTKIV